MNALGLVLLGLALVSWELLFTRWMLTTLRDQGRGPATAWRRLATSPIMLMGVILILGAVSPVAAGVLMAIVFAVASTFIVVLIVRGVRGLPEFARQVRRIGDPDAWRVRN